MQRPLCPGVRMSRASADGVLTGMTSLVTSGKNSFASMIASKESNIESTLEAINEAFLENE